MSGWDTYWNAAHTPRSTEPGDDARDNARVTDVAGVVSAPEGRGPCNGGPGPCLEDDKELRLFWKVMS